MINKEYILACLDKYCTFDGLSQENFYDKIVYPLEANQCFNNWTYDNGVSKGVLIFYDLNFVVKIPFEGREEYDCSHYVDKNGKYQYRYVTGATEKILNNEWERVEGEYIFNEFNGAYANDENLFENGSWDYCRLESVYYKKAESAGLEKCFAKTEYIGEANGHPIYIQTKCSMFDEERYGSRSDAYEKRTNDEYNSVKNIFNEVDFAEFFDRDWALDFLIYWGEDIFKRFLTFLKTMDIWDLHNGNLGYCKGIPCLVDYSSYRD